MGKDVMVMDRPSGTSINVGKVIAGGLLCGLINISETILNLPLSRRHDLGSESAQPSRYR
jgi:hypothetical protein